MNTLSENIALRRKSLGFSQETLAEKLGVTFQAVSKWENGKSTPDITLLPLFADIFDCSIDELFGRKASKCDLPWEDDGNIRLVMFEGTKYIAKRSNGKDFTAKLTGNAKNVTANCNLVIEGDVEGDCVSAHTMCVSGNVCGKLDSGHTISVGGDVNGDCNTGHSIVAGCDINGDVKCGNTVSAGHDINAYKITNASNVSANGDITVKGDLHIEGSITCTELTCESLYNPET